MSKRSNFPAGTGGDAHRKKTTAGPEGPGVASDAQGNRDPRPGASPGYDEQQPHSAAGAQQPGARRHGLPREKSERDEASEPEETPPAPRGPEAKPTLNRKPASRART